MDVKSLGHSVMRYGLVLVVAWIGAMKFTGYEAKAIEGLVANSFFMGWIYSVLSVRGASTLIGIAEIAIAVLIAARFWPRTVCHWERTGCRNISGHFELPVLDAGRCGSIRGWVSGIVGGSRAVPREGRRLAWGRPMVLGRSLGSI